jgi:AcrR family transcriptional regulator
MPDRRQKVTDDDVFAAAQRVMGRRGPHELTLADIAGEAGLTPGRLVQRFGSKRAMLVALSERFASSAGPVFAALRDASGSVRQFSICPILRRARPQLWWSSAMTRSCSSVTARTTVRRQNTTPPRWPKHWSAVFPLLSR